MKNIVRICMLFTLLFCFSCKDSNSNLNFHVSLGEASDAFLKSITIKADDVVVPLDTNFKPNLYNYEATVPYKVQSVKLEAMANVSSASVVISPENIEMGKIAGKATICIITVTSPNKEVKHRYFVQLNSRIPSREVRATSLVLSYDDGKIVPLNEAFYSGRTEYTADVPDDFNGSLKLRAFPYSVFAKSEDVRKDITEKVTKIEVEVKAEDENATSKKYSVTVSKVKKFSNDEATDLSVLYILYKGKYAEYDGKTNSYFLNVPTQDVESDIKTALEIKTYAECSLSDFDPSQTLATTEGAKKLYLINVYNSKGKNRNYKLFLVRGEKIVEGKSDNADLSRIEFITDVDEINPIDCTKDLNDVYNVPVNKKINSIRVVAVAADDKATLSVSPQSSTAINMDEKKDFVITVQAENGFEKKYVVSAHKSLNAFVKVFSEKKQIIKKDLLYLNDIQKRNPMFTGAFFSRDVEILPYEIGMYEVNYKLWYEVRKWAELQGYNFNNKGCQGENTGKISGGKLFPNEGVSPTSEKQYNPVTGISYRDAIVWCNAYSEMHDLKPVYYFDGKVLKDATLFKRKQVETTNGRYINYDYYYADMAVKDTSANGYRLPTMIEWEAAARGGDVEKKEWNYAFPGVQGYEDGKTLFDNQAYAFSSLADCAWYLKNAEKATHDIGEKKPNSLGIYDMAGNVYEICEEVRKFNNPDDSFDARYNTFVKGGSYQTGGLFPFTPPYFQDVYYTESKASDIGFRLAKTIK
ncbi:MAG: SUMF1/EgtB/PvdO family nonheme iron enzyme [Treponema sp.]